MIVTYLIAITIWTTKVSFAGHLEKTLPPEYEYSLCELLIGDTDRYQATLRLKITREKDAKSWLKQYQKLSRTTWRTRCTYPNTGRKLLCRLERMCHHNTRVKAEPSGGRRTKNTGCPAFLNIRVKKLFYRKGNTGHIRKCRSTDSHLPDWPTTITFTGSHNHAIDDPNILSHRDVSHAVKMKFIKLFQDGHSVTEALKIHKRDLAEEYGEECDKVVSDRHFCPDAQFCYRLYYDIFRKDTKSLSRRKVQELLEERISKYNNENGLCICSENVEGEDVIALVTPLMKRVHKMVPAAGEVVFVSNFVCGPGRPQLILLLTDSVAGGLPLGCLIVGSDSTVAIKHGLEMLHNLIGVGAYYGRGRKGPQVFLTSNSEEERLALDQMYPSAKQVLCIFHILQAFWQFLFGEEHQIADADRYNLFQQMKTLAICSSENEVQTKFTSIMKDPMIWKYSFVVTHFKEVFESRLHWALYHADLGGFKLPMNATNNLCDAMRVLKDRPFEKLKSANNYQLLDLVLSRVNGLFKNRLEDLAAGKLSRILTGRYGHIHCLSDFSKDLITEEQPQVFSMPRKPKSYEPRVFVDMDMGFCSCPSGITGGACKHQYILIRYFHIKKWKFEHVTDATSKKFLTTIAEGDTVSELEQLFTRLKEAFQRDPSKFVKPLGSFILQWAHYETDDQLVEAMQTFTKLRNDHQTKRKSRDESSCDGENESKRVKADGMSSEFGAIEILDATNAIMSTLSPGMEQNAPSTGINSVQYHEETASATNVDASSSGLGAVKSLDRTNVRRTLPTHMENIAPSTGIASVQCHEETNNATHQVDYVVDVGASAHKSQAIAAVAECVTNVQNVTLPTTSVEHDALSGLAKMAEQAEKLVRTAIMEGTLSKEPSGHGVSVDQDVENSVNEADLDNNSEPFIVEVITYE
ncbi:hypothetical protein BSL78_11340 [Apostichopus japonicus]|uniref:SWIM-type domain-containing protein n=1 Tax=Stichopus japonicus TaxID=307972 RepID=A0A2G8KV11_STIJA|nr:hypothetical protein BSL78_11340 [Apostichopus japonicus]